MSSRSGSTRSTVFVATISSRWCFFFSSRRRHTRFDCDWSSDVCSSDLVICLVMRRMEGEDISALAGLNQRSPFLAVTMTLAMVSLAGIPPLAGFFGKFLLLKAAVEQGAPNHAYYWLVALAIVGVVISLYYYFGVVGAVYLSQHPPDLLPIQIFTPIKGFLCLCVVGTVFLG